MIAEAHQAPITLGAQLALADLGRGATLPHGIGDAPTDLALHPSSPGYRLILNNVLFPEAKKKKLKT